MFRATKLEKFSIDYITGTTPSEQPANMAQIMFAHHDGVMSRDGSNYLNNSLHLDDVYSVISRDVSLSNVNNVTSLDTAKPCGVKLLSYNEPTKYTTSSEITPSASPEPETNPFPSPLDVRSGCCDAAELERGTPSPHRDSGIESDNSPVSNQESNKNIEKALSALDKKAANLTAKSKKSSDDKPGHSYIALIARAILSSPDYKLTLGDIYRHIVENHSYYDNEEKAWRNSIRYNLSINECFVKTGKEESGKGHYWGIHANCLEDFKKGDFRRRQARRRARRDIKAMKGVMAPGQTSPPNVSAYMPMTASYTGYQPYSTVSPAMMARQNQPTTAQYPSNPTPSLGRYYNTIQRYPVSQYVPMSAPTAAPVTGYNPPVYDYLHHQTSLTRGYPHENNSAIAPYTDARTPYHQHHEILPTWYERQTSQDSSMKREDIPDGNNIIIS